MEQATQTSRPRLERKLPVGADAAPGGGVHFRVWAPRRRTVEVLIEGNPPRAVELEREPEGYFSGIVQDAADGTLYRFRLDGGETAYPDPASRFQPLGPHGPSQVVDSSRFHWTDAGWKGARAEGQVVYEMHVGAFTAEGTWDAATRELEELRNLGITCLEVMPICEFPGRFGWGYDGVALFAPYHVYGNADAFRRFVDEAHRLGLAVILDVVYNHLGPDGNYVKEYSADYFNPHHRTDWGDALNFDGENSRPVREFFIASALHWITEYHLDGFRFDATQAIVDSSPRHILAEMSMKVRAAAPGRGLYLVNENEPQNTALVHPAERGGYGMDALWNDDFHHSAMVSLSGRNEAYYTDYRGSAQEFISAAKWGYLYQGQRYKWQKRRRGLPALDLPPTAFVHFIQNHDQVANSGRGLRAHQLCGPGQFRAMTALLLLMPQTPMLFQGQEFAASSGFFYFADHNPDLARLVGAGRAKELSQFPSVATPQMQACLLDPASEETFRRSKLDLSERGKPGHREIYRLHQDLLRLRRDEAAFARVQRRGDVDGAVLGPEAFVLRYFAVPAPGGGECASADDRLVVVNFGIDLPLDPAPEPLLAPPAGHVWAILFSSEDPVYGGSGTPPVDTEQEGWHLPGRCTVVLKPVPREQGAVETRFRVAGSSQEARRRERKE